MRKRLKTLLSLLLASVFLISAALPSLALAPSIPVSNTYASSKYYEALLQVQLTGDMRKDIVAVAKSQVGYLEGNYSWQVDGTVAGDENYTEYNNYMYGGKSGGWCGMFVSWCAAMAGVPTSILRRATSAKPYYYDGYGFNFISDKEGVSPLAGSDMKGFYDLPVKGGSYVPQAGDLIFFGYYNGKDVWSLPRSCYKHVGLVDYTRMIYKDDGSIDYMEIHTVEGNVSNKVREKVYKMSPSSSGYVYDNTYIAAFGIPAYETNETPDVYSYYDICEYGNTTLKYGSTGSAVIKLQLALRILAYVYPSIDAPDVTGTFDTATKTAVLQYQTLKKLSVDGKCGPQSWVSLRSTLIFETSRLSPDFIVDESGTLLFYKGNAASDTLPESCQKIAPYAFYENDSISTLTIHKTLKSVDKNAFAGVKALQEVICLGKNTEFSELDVKSTGNDAFLDAEKIYKYTTYYTITFDVNGQKTTLQCAENSLPVFEGSTEISDEEHRYFFIGWDRPIAPATEDTTYTATYHKISLKPLLLTGSATDHAFTNGKLSFDVYLMGTPGVSAFSFAADYSMYASELTFAGFAPAIDGVSCDASVAGMLQFTYAGACTAAGDLHVGKVTFDVSQTMCFEENATSSPVQLFFLITDGYVHHSLPTGEVTDLSVFCDFVEISVFNHLMYDYSDDQRLTISDVSTILDLLGGKTDTEGFDGSLKKTDPTIVDVANVLDLIAIEKKQTLQNGYTL